MRQHVAVLTACLLPPLLPRGLRTVSTSTRDRARAARSHLGSSRHTTSAPIRTMQNRFAARLRCCCCSVAQSARSPPHACRPVSASPSPSLPRCDVRSLARQQIGRAALLDCDCSKTPDKGVPVYGAHLSQSRGTCSDKTGKFALRSHYVHYVIVCLIECDHTRLARRGGDCHWGIAHLLSGAWSLGWFGRAPMLAAGVSSAGQIV
jgi:hypothetical protein